jgi:hypothetical protein
VVRYRFMGKRGGGLQKDLMCGTLSIYGSVLTFFIFVIKQDWLRPVLRIAKGLDFI